MRDLHDHHVERRIAGAGEPGLEAADVDAALGQGRADGVDDPGVIGAVDGDHVRGAGGRPAEVVDLVDRDRLEAELRRTRSRRPSRSPASTPSGSRTISITAKCPRRMDICESSMFPSSSSSAPLIAATIPGPVASDRGHGELGHAP